MPNSGLVLFQQLFAGLKLRDRLHGYFRRLPGGQVFGRATLFLKLIVHLLLDFRELRDARTYRDNSLVQRVLDLKCLPDVSTFSRMLSRADVRSVT